MPGFRYQSTDFEKFLSRHEDPGCLFRLPETAVGAESLAAGNFYFLNTFSHNFVSDYLKQRSVKSRLLHVQIVNRLL
jgi:hypothetical protein